MLDADAPARVIAPEAATAAPESSAAPTPDALVPITLIEPAPLALSDVAPAR